MSPHDSILLVVYVLNSHVACQSNQYMTRNDIACNVMVTVVDGHRIIMGYCLLVYEF